MSAPQASSLVARRQVSTELPFAQQLFQLTRPFNAISPLLAVLAGCLLAGGFGDTSFGLFALLAASLVLVHSGITLANDVADIEVDTANQVSTFLTQASDKTVRRVMALAVCLLLAGLGLAVLCMPMITYLSVAVIVGLGLVYNHPPLRLSTRPVGSLVVLALSYGFVPVLAGFSLVSDDVTLLFWVFALFYSLARVALSMLKDFKDVEGDTLNNKQTFLIRFGEASTRRISNVLASVGLVGLIVLTAVITSASSVILTGGALLVLTIVALCILGLRFMPVSRALPAAQSEFLPLLAKLDDMSFRFDKLVLLQVVFDAILVGFLLWS